MNWNENIVSLVLGMSISFSTYASDFYIGAGFGGINVDQATGSDIVSQELGTTKKYYVGYRANDYVDIELQYSNYGNADIKTVTSVESTWNPESYALGLNLGYPFSTGIKAFGSIGVSTTNLNQGGTLIWKDEFIEGGRLGLGLKYSFPQWKNVTVQIAYETDLFILETANTVSNSTGDMNIRLSSLYSSLQYRF
jgi:hypothetical protein